MDGRMLLLSVDGEDVILLRQSSFQTAGKRPIHYLVAANTKGIRD
jgi:hypothetical protein